MDRCDREGEGNKSLTLGTCYLLVTKDGIIMGHWEGKHMLDYQGPT